MSVGDTIRKLRKQQGLTQRELGDRCGMADSAIRRYESNRGNPTQETLQRIASALGVSISYLLGYETEKIVIPGRLKFVEVNDPKSGFIKYDIKAEDREAFLYGMKILEDAGIQAVSPQAYILAALDRLNPDGQHKLMERAEELLAMPRYCYQKAPPPE